MTCKLYQIPRSLALSLVFCASSLWAESQQIQIQDIHSLMEEVFQYHVEHKKLTPQLIKRSFKIFLQKFDPEKTYILLKEVAPFLEMESSRLHTVHRNYEKGDFSSYQDLHKIFLNCLQRSRQMRHEIQKQLIFATSEIKKSSKESYLSYARSEDELYERIKKQTVDFLLTQKATYSDIPWTAETRAKIFEYYEKKKSRIEESYDFSYEEEEDVFAMHVLKALAKSLDAHTAFFTTEEAMQIRMSLEKEFEGVGIVFRETLEGIEIGGIVKGSPAEKSGKITIGDCVREVDGEPVQGISYEQLVREITDRSKKAVELSLRRNEGEGKFSDFTVKLSAEKVVLQDERLKYESESFGDGIIAKLTLPSFYENRSGAGCEGDIRKALIQLKKRGKIQGLILDLRHNSGGFLQQAVKVAGLFITNGVIVISKYANNNIRYLRELDGRVYYQGPLLILTSKASASAAEIVAQALQDYGSALIAGDERTYGKGTIQYQTVTEAKAHAFYKVTVGKYYTVSGRSTQMEGVKADIIVPTEYAYYNIGERFLDYCLPNDHVSSAFVDSLNDVDSQTKSWMKKNYLPNVQQKNLHWQKMLPTLQKNSQYRQKSNKDFQLFLESIKSGRDTPSSDSNWGENDLQMQEAVHIIQDMLALDPSQN